MAISSNTLDTAQVKGVAQNLGIENGAHDGDNGAELLAMLDARRIRLSDRIAKPPMVMRIAGQQISTPGNITVIAAQAKAGKSAFLGGVLGSMFYPRGSDDASGDAPDCLGVECEAADDKAVVYFDTEQSPYDSQRNLERAAKRAGLDDFPDNLRPYGLLDVATLQRRVMLNIELQRAMAECGGIHAVIVDGIGDLCRSVNDEAEAIDLVDDLLALAVRYNCPLILVLHENPGENTTGKTRGHLGSQLERKAESNLRLVKGKDGITEVFSERGCRSASLPKGKGPCFVWSDEAGMHVRVEGREQDKANARRDGARQARDAVFAEVEGPLTHSELRQRIMDIQHCQTRTSESRIKNWLDMGLVKKDYAGKYLRSGD